MYTHSPRVYIKITAAHCFRPFLYIMFFRVRLLASVIVLKYNINIYIRISDDRRCVRPARYTAKTL